MSLTCPILTDRNAGGCEWLRLLLLFGPCLTRDDEGAGA